jgi:hypothetical protein
MMATLAHGRLSTIGYVLYALLISHTKGDAVKIMFRSRSIYFEGPGKLSHIKFEWLQHYVTNTAVSSKCGT